jgi:hypothetical protein
MYYFCRCPLGNATCQIFKLFALQFYNVFSYINLYKLSDYRTTFYRFQKVMHKFLHQPTTFYIIFVDSHLKLIPLKFEKIHVHILVKTLVIFFKRLQDVVSLSKKLYTHCSVQVGSRNGFETYSLLHNRTKIIYV